MRQPLQIGHPGSFGKCVNQCDFGTNYGAGIRRRESDGIFSCIYGRDILRVRARRGENARQRERPHHHLLLVLLRARSQRRLRLSAQNRSRVLAPDK